MRKLTLNIISVYGITSSAGADEKGRSVDKEIFI
jgi:hypothetical protein